MLQRRIKLSIMEFDIDEFFWYYIDNEENEKRKNYHVVAKFQDSLLLRLGAQLTDCC